MALADELGMRPLLARCHLGLAKPYLRTGARPKAQGHLTTATASLREMDMRLWLEQAEAELKALGGETRSSLAADPEDRRAFDGSRTFDALGSQASEREGAHDLDADTQRPHL
ncbi:MAG: hypothetical protein ACE5JD_16355 [Candidatus Methylomirabilia bacterium]